MKRYWDQYYPGGEYDAVARRKGQGGITGGPASRPAANTASVRGATPAGGARTRTPLGGANTAALQAELNQMKGAVEGLEKERDFYYNKLRDIELLVTQAVEENPELETSEDGLVKSIQQILYSTEEGFEIPEADQDDQETF